MQRKSLAQRAPKAYTRSHENTPFPAASPRQRPGNWLRHVGVGALPVAPTQPAFGGALAVLVNWRPWLQ